MPVRVLDRSRRGPLTRRFTGPRPTADSRQPTADSRQPTIGNSVSQRLQRLTTSLRTRFSTASGWASASRSWSRFDCGTERLLPRDRPARRVIATQYPEQVTCTQHEACHLRKGFRSPGGVGRQRGAAPDTRDSLERPHRHDRRTEDELSNRIEQQSVRVIDLKFSVDTLQIKGIQLRVDVHPRGPWVRAALCQHPLHSTRGIGRAACFDDPDGASNRVRGL